MKYLILTVALTIGTTVFAKDEFQLFQNDKYNLVSVESIGGHLYINCKKQTCDALRFLNTKPAERKPNATPEAGHPAARYCRDAGAENRILKENSVSKDEVDFCLFKDGSLVDAWDLYLRHYPANKKFGE